MVLFFLLPCPSFEVGALKYVTISFVFSEKLTGSILKFYRVTYVEYLNSRYIFTDFTLRTVTSWFMQSMIICAMTVLSCRCSAVYFCSSLMKAIKLESSSSCCRSTSHMIKVVTETRRNVRRNYNLSIL